MAEKKKTENETESFASLMRRLAAHPMALEILSQDSVSATGNQFQANHSNQSISSMISPTSQFTGRPQSSTSSAPSGLFSYKGKKNVRSSCILNEPTQAINCKPEIDFSRDFVVFLDGKLPESVVFGKELIELGKKGCVFRGIKFKKSMTEMQVKSSIYDGCESKLPRSVNFTLYNTTSKGIEPFSVAPTSELDGEFLYSRSHLKWFLYVLPDERLVEKDTDAESDSDEPIILSEKRTRYTPNQPKNQLDEFYDSLGSDEDIFIPKKRKCTTRFELGEGSSTMTPINDDIAFAEIQDVHDIVASFRNNVKTGNPLVLHIDRKEEVLPVLLPIVETSTFDIANKPCIYFRNEKGLGIGPIKDFFAKAMLEIHDSNVLEGADYQKNLKKNKRNHKLIENFGVICAFSIMHGGPSPAFFNRIFVTILLKGRDEALKLPLTSEDVADEHSKRELQAVVLADRNVAAINAAMAETQIFETAGTHTQVTGPQFDVQRDEAVRDALEYHCVDRVIEEVEAFSRGFDKYNLLSFLKCLPAGGEALFTRNNTVITTKELFLKQYLISTNVKETKVYGYFLEFLRRVEAKRTEFTLGDVHKWITGHDTIPPLGYGTHHPIILTRETGYVRARSCFNTLELPELVESYQDFEYAVSVNVGDIAFTDV